MLQGAPEQVQCGAPPAELAGPWRCVALAGLLDGAELPGVRADWAYKGPVFLKFYRCGTTPFDDLFTVFIDGVVHEGGEDVDSHEILPAFLPGFRYPNRPYE